MSARTVSAIIKHVYDPRHIGGGAVLWPERVSVGIIFSLVAIAPYVIKRGVSAGMFWFMREPFEAVGGFDESLVSVEDVDFGLRLKAYGQTHGKRYGTIRRNGVTTSCRKFDKFGDWYLFRNPRLVREIFEGTNRRAADHSHYPTWSADVQQVRGLDPQRRPAWSPFFNAECAVAAQLTADVKNCILSDRVKSKA